MSKFSKSLPSLSLKIILLILGTYLPTASYSFAQSIEYVIISINGDTEKYSLGQVLKEGQQLTIKENVQMHLLGKEGEVISLNGPISAVVTNDATAPEGERTLSVISKLLFEQNTFTQTLGGTRSHGAQTNIETAFPFSDVKNVWTPTLDDRNVYCLLRESPKIHRVNSTKPMSLMNKKQTGIEQKLVWKSGLHTLSLKKFVYDEDVLEISTDSKHKNFTVYLRQDSNVKMLEQANWMVRNGCHLQALMLIALTYYE